MTKQNNIATVICLRIGNKVMGWDWLNDKFANAINLPLGKEVVINLRGIPYFIQENRNVFEHAPEINVLFPSEDIALNGDKWYSCLCEELAAYYDTYYPGRTPDAPTIPREEGLVRWGSIETARSSMELIKDSGVEIEKDIPEITLIIQHVVKPFNEIEQPTLSDWLFGYTNWSWSFAKAANASILDDLYQAWIDGVRPRFWHN